MVVISDTHVLPKKIEIIRKSILSLLTTLDSYEFQQNLGKAKI